MKHSEAKSSITSPSVLEDSSSSQSWHPQGREQGFPHKAPSLTHVATRMARCAVRTLAPGPRVNRAHPPRTALVTLPPPFHIPQDCLTPVGSTGLGQY